MKFSGSAARGTRMMRLNLSIVSHGFCVRPNSVLPIYAETDVKLINSASTAVTET